MRLWSLHPSYLDARGLVALWREGLLARKVLMGQTKGYQYHPQLARFKAQADPVAAIDCYLQCVYQEASRRGYHFDVSKLGTKPRCSKIRIPDSQLRYELKHLKMKLKVRDLAQYQKILTLKEPKSHPLFKVVVGGIES